MLITEVDTYSNVNQLLLQYRPCYKIIGTKRRCQFALAPDMGPSTFELCTSTLKCVLNKVQVLMSLS